MDEFIPGDEEWICYPAMVGTMLIYCYFHRNYISSCYLWLTCLNLQAKEDTKNRKPDTVYLFGNLEESNILS